MIGVSTILFHFIENFLNTSASLEDGTLFAGEYLTPIEIEKSVKGWGGRVPWGVSILWGQRYILYVCAGSNKRLGTDWLAD